MMQTYLRESLPLSKREHGLVVTGSDQHWDPECEHHYEDIRYAWTNLSNIELDTAQTEYDLYYALDELEGSKKDFEETLQITKASRKENFVVKTIPGLSMEKPLLEMKKLMEWPPECTFLSSKATEMEARINGLGSNKIKVIIDSGSDITLISMEALKNLMHMPTIQAGQQINLIQVTSTLSISGFVKLDLYFETEQGPIKINVDAYVVKGNNFADQYSISVICHEGESLLTFGDTGWELKIFGSPDLLLHADDTFLHIANFSDSPVVISKDITSKAQHNVMEPDDPATQEPIEGGPKKPSKNSFKT
ncbi:hypothetical protein IW262DRAFT_1296942 [Armillaria fumosa]|nr:hypothetical protein IW262DRAFT_1296942 [Armillaria fumosa]